MKRRDALRMLGLGAATLAATGCGPLPASETSQVTAARSKSRRVRVYYTPSYVGSAHGFETTRKARWVADSLATDPISGIEQVANAALTEADLQPVHGQAYVIAVRTGEPRALAESQGFAWDPELWPMVLASNGGVVAAAETALADGVAGALSSGLHHARRDHGAGFCTFNGLAIAALRALDQGAQRVLIIDLDAHCGGGTYSLIAGRPQIHQLDVAVDDFDQYQPSGASTLDLVSDAAIYLPTIERRLAALGKERFDLCLYNAGMDPHEGGRVGGLPGIDHDMLARREELVFSWCRKKKLPVAFVLAGGYLGSGLDQAGLVALHRLTLAAASAA
jgi:acetoin utilization deacetylase AcuC-like enzyme